MKKILTKIEKFNKEPMDYETQLAAQLYKHFLRWPIKSSKLGQTDLVFGLWPEFISRSVHAGLQVSMCSGYDFWHFG